MCSDGLQVNESILRSVHLLIYPRIPWSKLLPLEPGQFINSFVCPANSMMQTVEKINFLFHLFFVQIIIIVRVLLCSHEVVCIYQCVSVSKLHPSEVHDM